MSLSDKAWEISGLVIDCDKTCLSNIECPKSLTTSEEQRLWNLGLSAFSKTLPGSSNSKIFTDILNDNTSDEQSYKDNPSNDNNIDKPYGPADTVEDISDALNESKSSVLNIDENGKNNNTEEKVRSKDISDALNESKSSVLNIDENGENNNREEKVRSKTPIAINTEDNEPLSSTLLTKSSESKSSIPTGRAIQRADMVMYIHQKYTSSKPYLKKYKDPTCQYDGPNSPTRVIVTRNKVINEFISMCDKQGIRVESLLLRRLLGEVEFVPTEYKNSDETNRVSNIGSMPSTVKEEFDENDEGWCIDGRFYGQIQSDSRTDVAKDTANIRKNDIFILNLENLNIVAVIGSVLAVMPSHSYTTYFLRNNRLELTDGIQKFGPRNSSDTGLSRIITNLPIGAKMIDVSYNTIGVQGTRLICKHLSNTLKSLTSLNVENCGLSDSNIGALLFAFAGRKDVGKDGVCWGTSSECEKNTKTKCFPLRHLCLAQNSFGSVSASAFSYFVNTNGCKLSSLDLRITGLTAYLFHLVVIALIGSNDVKDTKDERSTDIDDMIQKDTKDEHTSDFDGTIQSARKRNIHLKELKIGWNPIGSVSAKVFTESKSNIDENKPSGVKQSEAKGKVKISKTKKKNTKKKVKKLKGKKKKAKATKETFKCSKPKMLQKTAGIGALALARLLRFKPSTIIHLDASGLQFSSLELALLSSALQQNKKLLGLHFDLAEKSSTENGMTCVDSKGFLNVASSESAKYLCRLMPPPDAPPHSTMKTRRRRCMSPRVTKLQKTIPNISLKDITICTDFNKPRGCLNPECKSYHICSVCFGGHPQYRANQCKMGHQKVDNIDFAGVGFGRQCKICHGWKEHTFEFRPGISRFRELPPGPHADIMIHLSIDGWRGCSLKKSNSDDVFRLNRFLPTDCKLEYFYSAWKDKEAHTAFFFCARDQPRAISLRPEQICGIISEVNVLTITSPILKDISYRSGYLNHNTSLRESFVVPCPFAVKSTSLYQGADWTPMHSVWARRRYFTCDAKSFFDIPSNIECMFAKDWARLESSSSFRTFVTECDLPELKGKDMDDKKPMENLKKRLRKMYDEIVSVFDWARADGCCATNECVGSVSVSIDMPTFTSILQKAQICGRNTIMSNIEIEKIFLVAAEIGREIHLQLLNSDTNYDRLGLMRFEFCAALCYVAFRLFMRKSTDKTYSEDTHTFSPGSKTYITLPRALRLLWEQWIAPGLPSEAVTSRRSFRKNRLYTRDIDTVVERWLPKLQKLFQKTAQNTIKRGTSNNCFFPSDFNKDISEESTDAYAMHRLRGDQFYALLQHGGVVDAVFTEREARLAVVWALTQCQDELFPRNGKSATTTLSFEDFVEALVIVACLKPMPSLAEIKGCMNTFSIRERRNLDYISAGNKLRKLAPFYTAWKILEHRSYNNREGSAASRYSNTLILGYESSSSSDDDDPELNQCYLERPNKLNTADIEKLQNKASKQKRNDNQNDINHAKYQDPTDKSNANLQHLVEGPHVNMPLWNTLEAEIIGIMKSKKKLLHLWNNLDSNRNGVVSLREVLEFTKRKWRRLSYKPAVTRAFCAICRETDNIKNCFIGKMEFKQLLRNIFYFNQIWAFFCIADHHKGTNKNIEVTRNGHALDFREFRKGLKSLRIQMDKKQAREEFQSIDTNWSGTITFDDFCIWFAALRHPIEDDDVDDTTFVNSTSETNLTITTDDNYSSSKNNGNSKNKNKVLDYEEIAKTNKTMTDIVMEHEEKVVQDMEHEEKVVQEYNIRANTGRWKIHERFEMLLHLIEDSLLFKDKST